MHLHYREVGDPGTEDGHSLPGTAQRMHLLPGRRLQSNLPRRHHTDRGSQYCSHDYQNILRQHDFKVSMSGKGNCYPFRGLQANPCRSANNAAVETFFKTIKAELIWRYSWETRR
jgi:transposase InsO family protein